MPPKVTQRALRGSWKIRNFLRRPVRDQLLLVQTVLLLGVTRFLINMLTFARLERFLGTRMTESSEEISDEDRREARRLAKAIRRVSPHTPWESNCFPQALTAKILLRRRGIDSTLYLGAKFNDTKSALEAHAWLRSGPLYLTGGDGSEQYGAVATFS